MTNSRSNGSRSRLLAVAVLLAAVVVGGGAAHAGKKRVVVVLDFEGPKAERFHEELVRLIKQSHTVLSTDKWNGTAEELNAGAGTTKDIKRVAKKLGVDAVVEGKVEKRRDEFIIRLRLHDGKTGGLIGTPVNTKADGPKLDGKAQRDLKDELIAVIDTVELNHSGSVEEPEDVKPAKKAPKVEDEDVKPAKKPKKDDDDDAAKPRKFSKRLDEADKPVAKPADDDVKPAKKPKVEDDDALPPKKPKPVEDDAPTPKRAAKTAKPDDDDAPHKAKPGKKRVASRDGDEAGDEVDLDAAPLQPKLAVSPGERAVDVVGGISFTGRQLAFSFRTKLRSRPSDYNGLLPLPGAFLDATVYPLALGHKRSDRLKDLGLNLSLDRVLKISSKNAAGATFPTTESRYSIGAVFRYPFGRAVTAPVVFGVLDYASQGFQIENQLVAGIPSVKYSVIDVGVGAHYPLNAQFSLTADIKHLFIGSAGAIESVLQYGEASTSGFETSFGFDVLITPSIFLRGAIRYESIGMQFNGTGTLSNSRDGDVMTLDVGSARDRYFGGMFTVGYVN